MVFRSCCRQGSTTRRFPGCSSISTSLRSWWPSSSRNSPHTSTPSSRLRSTPPRNSPGAGALLVLVAGWCCCPHRWKVAHSAPFISAQDAGPGAAEAAGGGRGMAQCMGVIGPHWLACLYIGSVPTEVRCLRLPLRTAAHQSFFRGSYLIMALGAAFVVAVPAPALGLFVPGGRQGALPFWTRAAQDLREAAARLPVLRGGCDADEGRDEVRRKGGIADLARRLLRAES